MTIAKLIKCALRRKYIGMFLTILAIGGLISFSTAHLDVLGEHFLGDQALQIKSVIPKALNLLIPSSVDLPHWQTSLTIGAWILLWSVGSSYRSSAAAINTFVESAQQNAHNFAATFDATWGTNTLVDNVSANKSTRYFPQYIQRTYRSFWQRPLLIIAAWVTLIKFSHVPVIEKIRFLFIFNI